MSGRVWWWICLFLWVAGMLLAFLVSQWFVLLWVIVILIAVWHLIRLSRPS